MKKITRIVLTFSVNIIKFIMCMIDKIIFSVTGRKPVTENTEEGDHEIRFVDVPTSFIVRRYLGE